MLRVYYLFCDVFLFCVVAIRRLLYFNHNLVENYTNSKAIIIGNGPSLKEDISKIIEQAGGAEMYCVNYMALDDLFLTLKPRYYVLADPLFWRDDVNSSIHEDNARLLGRLCSVDWKIQVICPMAGRDTIANYLDENKNINVVGMPNYSINFRSEKITLFAFKLKIGSPIFANVLILALWHAIINKKQFIDIFGADFSSFKDYYVDQNTNELYSSYSHFYKNTEAQSNAGEKYPGAPKKKIHTRLYQSWMSFQQMYLLSLHARRKGVKVINRSSSSYLDCFDRN